MLQVTELIVLGLGLAGTYAGAYTLGHIDGSEGLAPDLARWPRRLLAPLAAPLRRLLWALLLGLLLTQAPAGAQDDASQPLRVCNWEPTGTAVVQEREGYVPLPMRLCPNTELRIEWEVLSEHRWQHNRVD